METSDRASWISSDAMETLLLSLAAVVLGIIGAVAAFLLYRMIMLFTNLAFYQQATFMIRYPPTDHIPLWMILLPAAGGLVVGLMAYYGTDRIRGHGIPEAMEAIITKKSRVGLRVAILKPISAAIAVGTGGPFGAEGPIIQTGGAISSLIGQLLPLTASERKVFIGCGAAAGMVGIFNTPLAAVAIVLELLLFEFRARSLVPVVIAAGVAAAARTVLIGPHLMFAVPPINYGGIWALPLFVPLAIILGLGAVIFSKGLFWVEELFEERLHLNMIWAPAVGGLVLGVIAYFEPRVLGMGYQTITNVLEGKLGAMEALELGVAKSVALWFALGSGTSGGLLAPMLLVGAAIGSAYGHVVAPLFGSLNLNPNVFSIVALAALFSAAARAPFTSFLFAFELTGDYNAIAPLMIACMIADIVARLFTRYSIMTERLAQRGLELPSDMEINLLEHLKVRSLMKTDFRIALTSTPVNDLLLELQQGQSAEARRHYWWVVEQSDGSLFGVITHQQVQEARHHPKLLDSPAWTIAQKNVVTTHPDDLAQDALREMLQHDVPFSLVVGTQNPRKVLGYVSRENALETAEWARMEDELVREGVVGSLGGLRRTPPRVGARGSVADASTAQATAPPCTNGRETHVPYQQDGKHNRGGNGNA